jgi:type II secretory pathway pseudopilin PulG
MSFKAEPGFTIIEILLALFVMGVVVTGVFGLFVLNVRLTTEAERRVVALGLIKERMEMIRNLPYVAVGTIGGVPDGSILQSEVVERSGWEFTVETDIRYVDDEYDGILGGSEPDEDCVPIAHYPPGNSGSCQDLCVGQGAVAAHLGHGDSTGEKCDGTPIVQNDPLNIDYKQVRVEVSWEARLPAAPLRVVTYVAPRTVEGGEAGGTLDFVVFNGEGLGVAGATLRVVNVELDPSVDITTQTNSEGRVVLPGLPEANESYQITVSKSGFTSDKTYDSSETFVPVAAYTHLSMLIDKITSKSFVIDVPAAVNLYTDDEAGVNIPAVTYRWRGTKIIGQDEAQASVYRIDITEATDSNGEADLTELVGDSYSLTVDGAATGYDIKKTSHVMPLAVNPGDNRELIVILVPHQTLSLRVAAVDQAGQPIDNASVRLLGNGFDQTLNTSVEGQVYFPSEPDSDLIPVAAENYLVEVTATGFEPLAATVEVTATEYFLAQLTPAN